MDKIPIRQCSQFCFIILLFFPLRPNHHKREAHQRHDYSLQIIETMWIFIKIPQQTNIQHLMQPNSKYVLCVYVCVCGCVRVCVNYVCIRAKKRALNKFWWNFVNDLHLNQSFLPQLKIVVQSEIMSSKPITYMCNLTNQKKKKIDVVQ